MHVGSGNNHGYVLTMEERKSRYGLTKILTSKKADYVIGEIKSLIKENIQFPFKSTPFDNGLEFTKADNLKILVLRFISLFLIHRGKEGVMKIKMVCLKNDFLKALIF